MKVMVYPSDTTGSGLYRMKYPAEAVKNLGVDVTLGSTGAEGEGIKIERLTDPNTGQQYVKPYPIDADVIVLQRVMQETTFAVMRSLQAAGHAVVVEMDDDMSCLHPNHPNREKFNPRLSPTCNWEILKWACRAADMVTVTSPALAQRYGAHGRVAVLPNCVPAKLLDLESTSDGRTVGWPGFTPTHQNDLRATGGGVADAIRRTGARFLQVGPPIGVKEQLGLDEEPEATGGIPDIDDYYRAITRLDVGIAPLGDTRFNAAKSWLKPLELAACGVPVVMSPVAEYARLHAQGVGVLANWRGRSWRQQVERLLRDESLRNELAWKAERVVEERHTYETQGHLWAEAWQDALRNAQSRPRSLAAA